MSAAPQGVLARSETRRDSPTLAIWLEQHNITYDRLLLILIPLTLLALLALVVMGGVGNQA